MRAERVLCVFVCKEEDTGRDSLGNRTLRKGVKI